MLIYKCDITLNVIFNLTFFYDFGNFRNVFYRLNQDDDDDDDDDDAYYYYYHYYFYVHNFIPTCFCASQKDHLIGKFITRKPISHVSRSNDCDIGFQVQFNVEFTSQVMVFP